MAIPNATKVKILDSSIDPVNDTIRVALYNDTIDYTQDIDAHDTLADVLDGATAEEFGNSGGTGYTRKDLTGKEVVVDDDDDEAVFNADDLRWDSLDGETIQGVIIYRETGADDSTPADDEILQVVDETDAPDSLPLTTNGGAVDLPWATEGIINLG